MNKDGFAYPSQRLIAIGARMSVRTAQRYLVEAQRTGWLCVENAGRGKQGWRHNAYRAAVPDGIPLDEVAIKHSERLEEHYGDLQDTKVDDSQVTSRSPKRAATAVSSPFPVLPAKRDATSKGDVNTSKKVTTNAPQRDDNQSQKVTTPECRTNSYSETPTPRTRAKTEARNAEASIPSDRESPDENAFGARLTLAEKIRALGKIGFAPDEITRQLAPQGATSTVVATCLQELRGAA